MINREFFNSNKISNIQSCTPQKSQTSFAQHLNTTQKLKRVTSCRDTTSRFNPQKFIQREVFKSKLYSAKPFDITVEFKKQMKQMIERTYSFQNNQHVANIQKQIQKQAAQQFAFGLQKLSHYFKTIHQEIELQGSNTSIKKQIILLKEGIEKILKVLCKQLKHCEETHMKMIFAQKSAEKMQKLSTHLEEFPTGNLLNEIKGLSSSKNIFESSIQKKLGDIGSDKNWVKPVTSSSLRSSKVIEQKSLSSNQAKNLTNKLNLAEFENKKHLLRIESLENEKRQNQGSIKELEKKIDSMSEKIGKVNELEEFYNYKIKKLKEELEVAHIVKEQNLAQKMKYILHH